MNGLIWTCILMLIIAGCLKKTNISRQCGKSCVNSIKTSLLGENYGRNNFYQGGFST